MALKYILNIDNIYWRVAIRLGHEKASKNFNFSKHEGKKSALIAAVKWRYKVLKKHGLLNRLNYKVAPDHFRTSTKYIGVRLTHTVQKNGIFKNWTARYSVNEIEYKRHFSIAKYGNAEAFRLACATRVRYCGKIIKARK